MNIILNVIPNVLIELILLIINAKIVIQIVKNVKVHIPKIIQIVKHVLQKKNFYILEIVSINVLKVIILTKLLINKHVIAN